MFCGKCGSRNQDDDLFCVSCGASLRRGGAPVAQVTPPAAPVYVPPVSVPMHMPSSPSYGSGTSGEWIDRVRWAMKEFFKSPLFLVTIICYTLIQLISLVSIGGGSVFSQLYASAGELGISESDMREMFSGIDMMFSSVNLVSMLPGILMTVGLWLTFGSAVGSKRQMTASGLAIIRVVHIVLCCLLGVVFVLVFIAILAASSSLGSGSDEVSSILGIALAVFVVIAALVFAYYGAVINCIRKVEDTIRTNVPDPGVSIGLAVVLFIIGGFSVLGSLASGLDLASLLQSVVTILWGVGIVVYRNRMSELDGEYYEYNRARVIRGEGVVSTTSSSIPAWKRVQIEQGLDD